MRSHSGRSDYRWWLILLILLGLFFTILTAWSIHSAQTPGRKVAGSYGKKRPVSSPSDAWERRGWTYHFSLVSRDFRAELRDASGLPLQGVSASLTLAPPGQGGISLPLSETAAGQYHARLPSSLTGTCAAEVALQRDGALLHRQLQVHAP